MLTKEIIEFIWSTLLIHDVIVIPIIFIVIDLFDNYKIVRKEKKDK